MYYTMTTIVEGEPYTYWVKADSREIALDELARLVQTDYWANLDDDQPDHDNTDYRGWVVSVVVTKDKPLMIYRGI